MIATKIGQLVDGAWVDAVGGGRWDVIDPATEEVVANVPFGGAPDVDRAIEAARRAFPAWRARTAYDRGAILARAAAIMRERSAQLAEVTVRETGKPLGDATREWQIAGDLFEFFAEEGKRVAGRTVPSRVATKRLFVLHEPIGVVGVITAWNFPAYNPGRAVAAALAAGCTVVMRGAELTPLTGMAMAEILVEAGVPPGAMNLVNGEPEAMGGAMLAHPDLRKLSFTGSVRVGKLLMDGASRTMTRLSLELGGNAPVLVLPDADVELVAKGAVAAKFRNAGQVCVSPQRFLVAAQHARAFEEVVVEETRKLPVGSGFDPATRVGPLISARHRERVEGLISAAASAGAVVRTGGARPPRKGYFLEPTVLGGVTPEMPAFSDEVFGPVFTMSTFDGLDEAIAAANRTSYGLAAYVFTRDLAAAMRAYERLDFGMIGVNDWAPQATEAPFVGRKDSGVGHEAGREGLYDNLETKLVSFGGVVP
ncbi:MAG: NAD-dependent succinate-semialdehyde dehydrogenase [Deltaproteobacteria bacterium]|nr:NAD-dependent succinate-semialdehyde dehydrogenase [Deltaproteobacteria bacterium]MCW5803335.1 NAD-dependent succinate-semialdehyde dehydrogenase [Deltaproteobacteria bacterium]